MAMIASSSMTRTDPWTEVSISCTAVLIRCTASALSMPMITPIWSGVKPSIEFSSKASRELWVRAARWACARDEMPSSASATGAPELAQIE